MAGTSQHDSKAWLLLLVGLIVSEIALVRGAILHSPYLLSDGPAGHDRVYYYAYTRSLVFDHDLDFANEFAIHPPTAPVFLKNKYALGAPLLSLPAFALVHWASGSAADTGYEIRYVLAYGLSQHLFGLLGIWLTFRALSHFVDPRSAALGTIVSWLGTNALLYTSLDLMMSHAAALFSISWCIAEAVRLRFGPITALGSLRFGLALAFVFVVRHQNAIIWLIPLALLVDRHTDESQPKRSLVVPALWAGLGLLIGFLPQALSWQMQFGSWFRQGYEDEALEFSWLHPHWHTIWHLSLRALPVFGLSMGATLVHCWRTPRKLLPLAILLTTLLHIYITAAWHCPEIWVRTAIDILFCWAFGLALLASWAHSTRSRALVWAGSAVVIAANLPFATVGDPASWQPAVWWKYTCALLRLR